MYIPTHFDEPGIEVMHELIRRRPLATLVTFANGLNADHIPLHLTDAAPAFGILRGHVARGNPMWVDYAKEIEVLAVFQDVNAYISPSWYATKRESGKVVPTWNYAVVHAYGNMRVIDDAAWIRNQLEALTAHNEAAFSEPWAVSDAPYDFTEKLIESIVGIEIVVTRMSGKWKVSQNQPPHNQVGVINGLKSGAQPEAAMMAALVAAKMKNAHE